MTALLAALLLAACGDDRPPAPTAEESRQLDEAEAMLNNAGEDSTPSPTDTGQNNI